VLIVLPRWLAGYLVNALQQLRILLQNSCIEIPDELDQLQKALALRFPKGQEGSPVDDLGNALQSLVNDHRRPPKLLTDLTGAAHVLDVHPSTVKRLARDGKLTKVKLGRSVRYRLSDLQKLVDGTE